MAGLFGAVSSNLALEQCFAHSVRPEWSTRRPEDVGRFSKVDVPGEPSSFYQSHRYPNGVYGRTDSTRFGASASRRLRDSESASGANLIATATSTKPMKLPTVDSIFGLSTAYDDDYQPQGFTRGPPFSECQETRDQFLPDSTFQLQKAPITLSPPAGDGAGAAATQPEATSSQAAADISGDAEGVWSIDIDQAFQEAMAIYPPCGRRKIIISDEGKMYGRNELIARYIKLRCGKTRTRKQVSSHIQVLARKKLRDEQAKKKTRFQSEAGLNSPVPSMATPTATTSSHAARPSSAAAVTPLPPPPSSSGSSSASASTPSPRIPNLPPLVPSLTAPLKVEPSSEQFSQQLFLNGLSPHLWNISQHPSSIPAHLPFSVDLARLVVPKAEASEVRPIASSSLSLLSFTAYVLSNMTSRRTELLKMDNSLEEDVLPISMFTDKYPPVLRELFDNSPSKDQFFLAKCWANLDFVEDIRNSQYAVDSYYSSPHKVHLKVSTMACSFAKKVVEKIEAYPPTEAVAGGGYSFALKASPMCDYMVQFISELKKLENVDYMNSVLENFTILQVVTNNETDETLMVMCFVFDVSRDPESSCSVFRLGV